MAKVGKIFKVICWLLFGAIALVATAVGTVVYMEEREAQAERAKDLAYRGSEGWTFQNKYGSVQVRTREGETIYRVVDRDRGFEVRVIKPELSTFTVLAIFPVECEPGTEIDTGKTFSSGNPKILHCSDDGDALGFGMSLTLDENTARYSLPEISENFGGFQFNVDLSDFDFTERNREIMLSRAKTSTPASSDQ